MSSFRNTDSRRHKRWEIFEYAVVLRQNDDQGEPAVIVDLSLGGMQARTHIAYDEGETVRISIAREEKPPIIITSEIRYCRPSDESDLFGIGFRFVPATVEERVELVNYIHERFQNDIERLAI